MAIMMLNSINIITMLHGFIFRLTFLLFSDIIPHMTNDEKFIAIVERLKAEDWCDEPAYISVLVIINYLDELQKLGLIYGVSCSMTERGKRVAAIVDEFNWSPSDEEIDRYVNDMVEKENQNTFSFLIKRYRDHKEELKEELMEESKKYKESDEV